MLTTGIDQTYSLVENVALFCKAKAISSKCIEIDEAECTLEISQMCLAVIAGVETLEMPSANPERAIQAKQLKSNMDFPKALRDRLAKAAQ
jgi:hypothetical protein